MSNTTCSSTDHSPEGTNDVPVEVASQFFTGVNDPRPTTVDFSLDGLYFVSSHADDAVRIVDTSSLSHTETIRCESFGVHAVRFTQSSNVVCVAPRFPLDGHLYLLNLETAQFFSEMAYVDDMEGDMHPVANTPVYGTIAQCPSTDVMAVTVTGQGRLALFHPLIAGAIASSAPKSVVGSKSCVSFSSDGNQMVVGDDKGVTLFDFRMLFSAPLSRIENKVIFTESPGTVRCKGAEVSADGAQLLLTSSSGEVLLYDWREASVLSNYFHDDAKRHFVGSGDAIGAKFVYPYISPSPIVQLTSSMVGGRHLLVYNAFHRDQTEAVAVDAHVPTPQSSSYQLGSLQYELQSRDSDVPVAMTVNPAYSVVATAARNVTWWAFKH